MSLSQLICISINMADWDSIRYAFNASDETVNFGTRILAGIDNLYETSTLASFRNSDVSNEIPNIHAIIKNGFVIFSINKTVRVFDDLSCNQLVLNATLDDEVDVICCKGFYLLLCLRNGTIYVFDLHEDFTVICNRVVIETSDSLEPIFVDAFAEDGHALSFIIVSKFGVIYRLSLVTQADGPATDTCDILTDLTCHTLSATYTRSSLHLCGNNVYSYDIKTNEVSREENTNFKRIFSLGFGKLLGLDSEGSLSVICTRTYLTYLININTLYDEIITISDENGFQLLGVTKRDVENNVYLQLINIEDLTAVFSIKLSQEIRLIVPENIHDEILYLSVFRSQETISELRLQSVTETIPENRLKRLIKRQKFDEAEKFADLFHLNLVEIQKSKARFIADKIVCETDDIDNLMKIMEIIEDVAFKIEICLDVHSYCTNLEDVERILKYGYNCIQPDTDLGNHYHNASSTLFRFRTFTELVKYGRPDGDIQDWNNFSMCNLIGELCSCLTHNRIDEAIIIYNRLDTKDIYELNEDVIKQILTLLNDLSFYKALPFLYVFIPPTLMHLPLSLPLFIDWILDRVKHIEMREANKFPDSAIEFLQRTIQILTFNYSKGINCRTLHIMDRDVLDDLVEHLHALELLRTLKHKYRILLSFQEFLQGPKILAQILLSGSSASILDDDAFFADLINTLGDTLNPDEIFVNLVKDLTEYEEELWIKVVPLVLERITTVKLKLESTLYVVKSASLPWSKSIRALAKSSLKYAHPLVTEIANEIDYEPKSTVLNNSQYKLNEQLFESLSYVKFALQRIIHLNLPTMMDDIFQICVDTEERHEANMALITHFIEKDELETALQILDNNKPSEIVRCCKELAIQATQAINNNYKQTDFSKNYYNIIGSIYKRLADFTEFDFEKAHLQDNLETLCYIHKINTTFNARITTNRIQNSKNKQEALLVIVSEMCPEEPNCFAQLRSAALDLQLPEHSVLLNYCRQVDDFSLVLESCQKIYQADSDPKTVCAAVGLIIKHVGASQADHGKSTDFFFDSGQRKDVNLLVDGLKLARKMVVKAILDGDESDLSGCFELANWIQTSYFFTQSVKQDCADLKGDYGLNFFSVATESALNAFSDTLQLYIKFVGSEMSNVTNYLTYIDQDNSGFDTSKEQLSNELSLLFSTFKCIINEGQALTALKLTLTLQRACLYLHNPTEKPAWFQTLSDIHKYTVQQVQHKNLSLKRMDKDFAYNLLFCSKPHEAKLFLTNSLRTYKRDLDKYRGIAEIQLRFLKHYDIVAGQEFCQAIISMVDWWKKIKNCPIPYDKFFSKEPKELLKRLIKLDQLNLHSLKDYCIDFDINVKDCYKSYLKYMLMNWKPEVENDVQNVIVKSSEDQLYNSCLGVINVINDSEAVLETTNYLWKMISFYHYEVYLCILKIEALLNPNVDRTQHKNLLLLLKNYTRVGNPGQTEIEEWFTLNPNSHTIDFMSKWRVPFTPTLFTNSIWSIIRPEVNLKTYKIWFDASLFLKNLTKDDICSYAIKEVVSSGVFQLPPISDSWILESKHQDLIQKIKECVKHITNMERATSAVYLLATNIPGGADQISLISLCYKYALKYKEQCPQSQDVQRAVMKVHNKYYSISVTHILHKNKLADKSYLDMVTHPPSDLIDSLYMDERICKKALVADLYCPDINKTVDEIALLHNFDVVDKRREMIMNWLSNDLHIGRGDMSNAEETNLIRASYVCTSGNREDWSSWLLQLSTGSTSVRNFNFKARILKCLCNISSAAAIEKLANISYRDYRNYIERLTIAGNLESFGFHFTIDKLDLMKKCDLLFHLARVGTPLAAKTMASICITYNIIEVKYWTIIITGILKLNLVDELKKCIYFLKKHSIYYDQSFYIEAWQKVIDKSFDLSQNLDQEDLTKLCISNFGIIQSCPILDLLDVEPIIKKCIQLKKCEFAILIFSHLNSTAQENYATELFKIDESICEKAKQLSCYGFKGVLQECEIIERARLKYGNGVI